MATASDPTTPNDTIREHFYLGGQWVRPASGKRFELVNPATEDVYGSVPEGVEADIDRAVSAARNAFDHGPWGETTPAERAAAMSRLADALERRGSEIAPTVSAENGMPVSFAQEIEAGLSFGVLRYYASVAEQLQEEEQRTAPTEDQAIVRRVPIGVVAAIVPWNYPVTLTMHKLGPALAAGCSVVIKPSPGTALDWYFIAEAAKEAGVPPGVINWVPGDRPAGAYLVSHPDIDKVTFTGSPEAGRKVARACGELLRPVTLELGGKSAAVVLDDADLDAVTGGLAFASFTNNGQTCFACTRILAPENRYGEVVDSLGELATSLQVGDPLDPETQLGPMASAAQHERVLGYVEQGKQEGRCVTGGGPPANAGRDWFVEPTIFADVDNHATIARARNFLGQCYQLSRTRTTPMLCALPAIRNTDWAARCGPPTETAPWMSPGRWRPVASASTATTSPPARRSGVLKPVAWAGSWRPRRWPITSR